METKPTNLNWWVFFFGFRRNHQQYVTIPGGYQFLSSWWLNQPICKNMLVTLDHLPTNRDEKNKDLTWHHLVMVGRNQPESKSSQRKPPNPPSHRHLYHPHGDCSNSAVSSALGEFHGLPAGGGYCHTGSWEPKNIAQNIEATCVGKMLCIYLEYFCKDTQLFPLIEWLQEQQ